MSVNKQVSLKKVLAVVGVLVVLGGTFYAGMAYENHRIQKGFEEAFSGLGEGPEDDSTGEDESTETTAPEAVELVKNKPLVVELADEDFDDESDGQVTVTLTDARTGEASGSYEEQPDLTRNLTWYVKIENTGDTVVEPSLQGHFESDDGEVFDFTGVMCDDEIPSESIKPGQFLAGCGTSDIPSDAGRFVFDGDQTTFFIPVKAS